MVSSEMDEEAKQGEKTQQQSFSQSSQAVVH
jgi:hypothetical protein